jgi:disulfide bond formation protein DsbB
MLRLLLPRAGCSPSRASYALGLVAGGVVLAQTMNLAACPLCILQRMLYLLLALESGRAWMLAGAKLPGA